MSPKTTNLLNARTMVFTKWGNPYVNGGLVIANCTKGIIPNRRRRPFVFLSKTYSTIPGRKNKILLKRLDDLRVHIQSHKPGTIDRNLYKDFMLNEDMFLVAYQKLKSKPGNMTPGINPTTLDGMSIEVLRNIIEQLKTQEFKFTPGRRKLIPKANGKSRLLFPPLSSLS